MKIISWNVNGIKARLPLVLDWIKKNNPDIVALQEIKCLSESFPYMEFEDLGYNIKVNGQKSFNGVALLSKIPFSETSKGLGLIKEGEKEEQARLIEGVFSIDKTVIRVCNIYLPNGNPVNSDKFPYKLAWMDRLIDFAKERLTYEEPFILLGDFNIIPAPIDVYDPKEWWGDALYREESLAKFRTLLNIGLRDCLRLVSDEVIYSFWDFQKGAWKKNNGLRIDHILASPLACDALTSARIDKAPRSYERPSDHVPIIGEFF